MLLPKNKKVSLNVLIKCKEPSGETVYRYGNTILNDLVPNDLRLA